jgi:hypothetical protein
VSALAHHIEAAGVATATISLVREHTEGIKPPRALWVPFDLGRPLGPPGDAPFQRDVLRALLALFEAESGPVLSDFPHEAPSLGDHGEGAWSCPLPLPPPPVPGTAAELLVHQLREEVAALRPWYEESRRTRARTVASGVDPEAAADLIARIANGESPEAPADARLPMPALIRFAADDLKAFYVEAATARPSAAPPSPADINRWLYSETTLGEALHRARGALSQSSDDTWKAQSRLLVPAALVRRSNTT